VPHPGGVALLLPFTTFVLMKENISFKEILQNLKWGAIVNAAVLHDGRWRC
jgi:hypothetical protein